MGCKGPLDARINAFESARRALSDYGYQHAPKRTKAYPTSNGAPWSC